MPLSVAFGTAGPIKAPREGEDAIYVRSVGEPDAAPPSGDSSTTQELQDILEGEAEETAPWHRGLGEEIPWAHLENEDEKSWKFGVWSPGRMICRLTVETISLGVCHHLF